MAKKIKTIGCLLSTITVAHASILNNVYIGVAGGALESFANVASTTSASLIAATDESGLQTMNLGSPNHLGKTFGNGTIYIGVEKQFGAKPLYLAGEIYGAVASKQNISNISSSEAFIGDDSPPGIGQLNNTQSTKLKTFEFGIDIKPGIYFNDKLASLYGRIGAAFNQYQLTSSSTFVFNNLGSPTSNTEVNGSSSKSVTGLRLGAGTQLKVYKHVYLTLDYIYTIYPGGPSIHQAANVQNTGNGDVTTNGLVNQVNTSMNTQTALFGLKVYFDKP